MFLDEYDKETSLCDVEDMKRIHSILFPACGARIGYDAPEVRSFFPECNIHPLLISLSTKDTQRQNKLYRELLKEVERLKALKAQAQKMVAELRYRQETELLKCEAIAELAKGYLDDGKSVVIFVNFRPTLEYLAKRLKTTETIHGSRKDRATVEARFQANKTNLLICTVEAGGQSLSLHDLHGGHQRVSLVCPTYKPITVKQVLGRTRRAGSKSIPIMHLVYAGGTIEEKVSHTVNRKIDNLAALNDGDLMEPDLLQLNQGW